jgi:hypothetical protein
LEQKQTTVDTGLKFWPESFPALVGKFPVLLNRVHLESPATTALFSVSEVAEAAILQNSL